MEVPHFGKQQLSSRSFCTRQEQIHVKADAVAWNFYWSHRAQTLKDALKHAAATETVPYGFHLWCADSVWKCWSIAAIWILRLWQPASVCIKKNTETNIKIIIIWSLHLVILNVIGSVCVESIYMFCKIRLALGAIQRPGRFSSLLFGCSWAVFMLWQHNRSSWMSDSRVSQQKIPL